MVWGGEGEREGAPLAEGGGRGGQAAAEVGGSGAEEEEVGGEGVGPQVRFEVGVGGLGGRSVDLEVEGVIVDGDGGFAVGEGFDLVAECHEGGQDARPVEDLPIAGGLEVGGFGSGDEASGEFVGESGEGEVDGLSGAMAGPGAEGVEGGVRGVRHEF